MHPNWATDILQQCQEFEVPFHFKQWGHWVPAEVVEDEEGVSAKLVQFADERPVKMARLAKKLAGRLLEGTTWDGVPGAELIHAES